MYKYIFICFYAPLLLSILITLSWLALTMDEPLSALEQRSRNTLSNVSHSSEK